MNRLNNPDRSGSTGKIPAQVHKVLGKYLRKEYISFLVVNMGNIPIMTFVSSFLAVYYVDVLEMNEVAVGTMFLIARIFDGINDPVIGFFIDRLPDKPFGKFRMTLIIGTCICVVNFLALWICPAAVPASCRLFTAYAAYLLLGITFPVMDISLNSLIPVMTADAGERNVLSTIKIVGYGLGAMSVGTGIPFLLKIMGTTIGSYLTAAVFISMSVCAFSILGTLGIRQKVRVNRQKRYSIREYFTIIMHRPVISIFVSGLFFYTGNAMLITGDTYYAVYYLGDVAWMTYMTFATYLSEGIVILTAAGFTERFGKKRMFGAGLLAAGAGVCLRAVGTSLWPARVCLTLLSSTFYGIGYGFAMILFYGIQADNVDYIEQKTALRAEGAVASLISMVNKMGKGIGGAFTMYILGILKRPDGHYAAESLRLIDGMIPAVFFICGGVLFLMMYPKERTKSNAL